jgi:hypothetical protein
MAWKPILNFLQLFILIYAEDTKWQEGMPNIRKNISVIEAG